MTLARSVIERRMQLLQVHRSRLSDPQGQADVPDVGDVTGQEVLGSANRAGRPTDERGQGELVAGVGGGVGSGPRAIGRVRVGGACPGASRLA